MISAPRTRRTPPASRRSLSFGLLSFDGALSLDLNSGLSQFRSCQNRPIVILIVLFYRRLRVAMPSRQQPRAHAAPYVTGPAELPRPKQRRCGPECHTKPAPTAAAILAKRNTPFSSSRINTLHAGVGGRRWSGRNGLRSARPGVRPPAHPTYGLPSAPLRNSVFRQKTPCSGDLSVSGKGS